VFDPERDEEQGARPFYLRLLAVAAVTAVVCVALWPSVTSFPAGVDRKGCLAVADGWHTDRPAPTAADRAVEAAAGPYTRTSAEEQHVLDRVYAYDDWRAGPGACVPQSRHRLILSGLGLAAMAAVVTGIAIGRSLRLRARELPAAMAAGSVENLV
jgi:hypothetical protein